MYNHVVRKIDDTRKHVILLTNKQTTMFIRRKVRTGFVSYYIHCELVSVYCEINIPIVNIPLGMLIMN